MCRGFFFLVCLTVIILLSVEAKFPDSNGCKDRLPIKMNTDKNCKRLNKNCSNLKYVCYLRLGSAIGISDYAYKCRDELGYRKNKKVEDFCKKSCNKCG